MAPSIDKPVAASPIDKPVALVIGASRGIGRQIAIDLAKKGYAVVVSAKSTTDPSALASLSPFPPDPNSALSTITTVAHEITTLHSGTALAIPCDTSDPTGSSLKILIASTIKAYGHLDVLIYNSGAIWWSSVSSTPLKRYQLMQRVNADGLYAAIQFALPYLHESTYGGRIVVVCPPIYSRFFRGKTAYAMGKVAMSVLVKGLAMDFERESVKGMAVSGIWPAVAIESAATANKQEEKHSELRGDLRHATIFSDAILGVLESPAEKVNGKLLLDEDFLREQWGVKDFEKYSVVKGSRPRRIMPRVLPDLTVEEQDDEGARYDSAKERKKKKGSKL
ncbi:hypothetical protein NEUTE1DRAFT_82124 [Neurospora tetrasperma FGSC 2508]|uniref:NAD(P)-binding protein n=1 Tax=Neurospora tetrasperma (strain FGSC 2508 / ATCC MYA-4615 / P0657) TaxID=510951 RepID=F8MMY4_NEUT8|nr:uncharacterized protein NEUTE1DRAFT_82124 [Neurospora tetrasperma FGSC 2508]EGO58008.1 hypothetical protein NEUTE1DRAFT_82124 [Neurospora tetrasperma FGSC 2508]EGZ71688.1 NAD(P)-binding protein [Neurospora tetrasperma FGSC 2509]